MIILKLDILDGKGIIELVVSNKDYDRLSLYLKDYITLLDLVDENRIIIEELKEADEVKNA